MHVIAGKAVAFKEALTKEFVAYQKQVISNAKAMANVLTRRGVRIVSGGTDSHMFLVDLTGKKITGKMAENVLGASRALPSPPKPPDTPPDGVDGSTIEGQVCVKIDWAETDSAASAAARSSARRWSTWTSSW